jgi:hypothetical protein
VWEIVNPVVGIPMSCHGELRWVKLGFFSTDEMALCVCQVDEIDSSLGQRVSHC